MEALYDEGKKAIGVSNVGPREVDELMKFARIKPHVVQAWMDPFHSSAKLRETCEKHNIRFMAYSTLGTQWSMQGRANPVLSSSKLREYGDPAHVALSWALLRNAVVIPRSFSDERIAANARLYDGGVLSVGLDAAALEAIDALDGTLDGSDDVQAVFANDGDEAVRLFWKGPDGDVEVGSAAPGASVEISTYRGHEFAAKLHRHEEAFATYKIGAARRQTFRVRDPETQDLIMCVLPQQVVAVTGRAFKPAAPDAGLLRPCRRRSDTLRNTSDVQAHAGVQRDGVAAASSLRSSPPQRNGRGVRRGHRLNAFRLNSGRPNQVGQRTPRQAII